MRCQEGELDLSRGAMIWNAQLRIKRWLKAISADRRLEKIPILRFYRGAGLQFVIDDAERARLAVPVDAIDPAPNLQWHRPAWHLGNNALRINFEGNWCKRFVSLSQSIGIDGRRYQVDNLGFCQFP